MSIPTPDNNGETLHTKATKTQSDNNHNICKRAQNGRRRECNDQDDAKSTISPDKHSHVEVDEVNDIPEHVIAKPRRKHPNGLPALLRIQVRRKEAADQVPPLSGGEDKSPVGEEEESLGASGGGGRGRRSPSLPLGPGGPYKCSECKGAYPSREFLKKHELLHSPNNQSCKICNKSFLNVYRLQRHMISHDESALLRKFKCNDCDKAFKFKHHLKEHLRIHSGEKPFECGNCGKKFSHSGSYSSHMTSKKCLVMNLKMGRIRPNNPALNPERSPSRKRSSSSLSQMNNNTTNNNNAFLPMLPNKYNEVTAALLASMAPRDGAFPASPGPLGAPGIHPLYMPQAMPLHHPGAIAPFSLPASLSHLFEQITSSQYLSRKMENEMISRRARSMDEAPEEDDKRSSVGDEKELVMDLEEEDTVKIKQEKDHEEPRLADTPSLSYQDRVSPNTSSNSGELGGGLNMILERVNASVTKHLLQATCNMHSLSPHSGTTCPDVSSSPTIAIKSDPDELLKCPNCHKTFNHKTELAQHEQVLCGTLFRKHEGLAAQVAETLALNRMEAEIHASINSGVSGSDDEEYSKENDGKSTHEGERKVRVRTAISDEQQAILKEHYAQNQRPNREEFKKIAQRLGLDNRVVQVWFQNNRARVRRMNQSLSYVEQPLDLSTKKTSRSDTSSPSVSPPCNTSTALSDSGEEAVNLSQKSSRSPTPYHNNFQSPYQHSNCSSSSLIDFHRSPSPNDSSINGSRIYAHSQHLLKSQLSPIASEKMGAYDSERPHTPLSITHIGIDGGSSPGSERRSWTDETRISQDMDVDEQPSKKNQLRTLNESKEVEGQFICDQCDKAFVKQSSLARHKYEHSGQRPYKCIECPKAFKHKHHLTEHKRLHTGEKPFQCCKCLKKFSHSGSYSQHMNHRYSYCKPYRE